MGTRNLTIVYYQDECKIAQYGQWSGEPSGQGETILEFLHNVELDLFKEKVSKLLWMTEELWRMVEDDKNWEDNYPHLSRDMGGGILRYITSHPNPLRVSNQLAFAGNSLHCEYAYVIDLDKHVFEFYVGFNEQPITEGRFKSDDKELERAMNKDYHPVIMVSSYSLDELPLVEDLIADEEAFNEAKEAILISSEE